MSAPVTAQELVAALEAYEDTVYSITGVVLTLLPLAVRLQAMEQALLAVRAS